jgi:O-acetyl-ADP-ribose deacetylase (regulator of RNase III)
MVMCNLHNNCYLTCKECVDWDLGEQYGSTYHICSQCYSSYSNHKVHGEFVILYVIDQVEVIISTTQWPKEKGQKEQTSIYKDYTEN